MSIQGKDSGERVSREQISNYRRWDENDQSGRERDARIDRILSRIEQNEQDIDANAQMISDEVGQEDLLEAIVAWAMVRDIEAQQQSSRNKGDSPAGHLIDQALKGSAVDEDKVQSLVDSTASSRQVSQGAGTPTTEAERSSRAGNQPTEQFRQFVRSSTLGGVVLMILFTSLFIQGAVSTAVVAPIVGLLVIAVVGFGGTWWETTR